eukprot:6201274-Pleurochrysis_carterae.AAC.1
MPTTSILSSSVRVRHACSVPPPRRRRLGCEVSGHIRDKVHCGGGAAPCLESRPAAGEKERRSSDWGNILARFRRLLAVVADPSTMIRGCTAALVQMTSVADTAANLCACAGHVKNAAGKGAKFVFFPENFAFMGKRPGHAQEVCNTTQNSRGVVKAISLEALASLRLLNVPMFSQRSFCDAPCGRPGLSCRIAARHDTVKSMWTVCNLARRVRSPSRSTGR